MQKQERRKIDRAQICVSEWFPCLILASALLAISVNYLDVIPDSILYGKMGKKGYIERCVDGVAYVDNGHIITPKIDMTSSPIACG